MIVKCQVFRKSECGKLLLWRRIYCIAKFFTKLRRCVRSEAISSHILNIEIASSLHSSQKRYSWTDFFDEITNIGNLSYYQIPLLNFTHPYTHQTQTGTPRTVQSPSQRQCRIAFFRRCLRSLHSWAGESVGLAVKR